MTVFEVDESSGLPVWVQLRNRFVYLINTGYYKAGDQLPSVRSLAAETAINYNTVSKVYINLEHDGYVMSIRGKGVFVRNTGAKKQDDTKKVADAILEDAIKRCQTLGMSLDEVKLRMFDVAQKVQEDSRSLASEKRELYEGKGSQTDD